MTSASGNFVRWSLRTDAAFRRCSSTIWNGVHWDFMLEAGDVLRTWAIDAPIVAGRDLPARALADHRLIYLEYEGEISGNRGQCPAGRRGDLSRRLIWTADHVRVALGGVSTRRRGRPVAHRAAGSGGAVAWIFRLGNLD